ncbi:hypothetical transcript [Echinococcus multilocularis]|uniref:Hypothetical transcript n=1 Tax=Echinococcus multilocularis TaxID=6211 RepID=A0A087VZC2_ECHMU|nr:hypothetical transcript [Echinococcus multilocularis]
MEMRSVYTLLLSLQIAYTFSLEVAENRLTKQIRIKSDDLLQTQAEEVTAEVKHGEHRQYFVLRKSGVFILLNITSVDLLRIFEEVQHAGDDLHILTSSDDLGPPDKTRHDFEYITNNFCRTPIPDRYFIVLQSFRNRYTIAYRAPRSASGADTNRPRAQRLASLKRSLNKQCSRNLAAPLVDNDNASDSFYCIKDSPLLNNLFGQYVEESIYVKKSHDCSKFQMACLKCFKQAKLIANSSSHKFSSRKDEEPL